MASPAAALSALVADQQATTQLKNVGLSPAASMTGSQNPDSLDLPLLSPICLSLFMDDCSDSHLVNNVSLQQTTTSAESNVPKSGPDIIVDRTATNFETLNDRTQLAKSTSILTPLVNATLVNTEQLRNLPPVYQRAHGHFNELLSAHTNQPQPLLGEEWAPQSPPDPLLIPTTFSPTCSSGALSPCYTTLTPATPHLAAQFLGSGQLSVPLVPAAPNKQFGHGCDVAAGTPSSLSTLSIGQPKAARDPELWGKAPTGSVSPLGAEVWQNLERASAPPLRRSTSRSPLSERASPCLPPYRSKSVTTKYNLKCRTQRTTDDKVPVSGVGQQWTKGFGNVGRGSQCSTEAMEEEDTHNKSRESLATVESDNNSKHSEYSVQTDIDPSLDDARHEKVHVPSGKCNGAQFELMLCARMYILSEQSRVHSLHNLFYFIVHLY